MILGLDIATKTGWAVGLPRSSPIVGTIAVSGTVGQKCVGLFRSLDAIVTEHEPDLIVFEQPIHAVPRQGSSITLRLALGLCAVAEMVAAKHAIKVLEVPMGTWRKHFIGVGRAPAWAGSATKRRQWLKNMAIQRCRDLKWGDLSDDEAEACGVWDYASSLRSAEHATGTVGGMFKAS